MLFGEQVFASVPAREDGHTKCGYVQKITSNDEKDALRAIGLGVCCNCGQCLNVQTARDRGPAGMAMPFTNIVSLSGIALP